MKAENPAVVCDLLPRAAAVISTRPMAVCTENPESDVVVIQPTEEGV